MPFALDKNTLYAFLGAFAAALGYFAISTNQIWRAERIEQQHLIDITNAFTRAYSEQRTPQTVVPATFRRIGMDHFTSAVGLSTDTSEAASSMRMPGLPGLEIETVEQDARIRDYIQSLENTPDTQRIEEFRLENNRLIARTIVPSIASNETCVACHNTALGTEHYQLGDVMGAFVVETNLTKGVINNAFFAGGAFLIVLCGALLVARREKNRMQSVVEALTRQVDAESHANFLASHDTLTGLANRKMFRDKLDNEVTTSNGAPGHDPLAIIVDVDDFKIINDTMGHDAGDAVLKDVADRFAGLVGEHDGTAARLGGDEFAAIVTLPTDTSEDQFGQTLIAALSQPIQFNEKNINPSVSIGVAALSQLDNRGPSQLLKAADLALYAAKRRGKLCYNVFDDHLKTELDRRTHLASALPKALANGTFRAILQPQIDVQTNALIGFEALARWQHEGTDISPLEFIALAEETGQIIELDLCVMRQAAVLVGSLIEQTGRPLRLSVNISTVDLRSEGLAEQIADVLLETNFDANLLTVEITESALLEDWRAVRPRLDQIRDLGVRIALDDFGTGYASLSYLTQFSFDAIKVDRTFLRDIDTDPKRAILLKHIINLARSLDKQVVVEGIETSIHADRIAELGAQVGQGLFYGLDIEGSTSHPATMSEDMRLSA